MPRYVIIAIGFLACLQVEFLAAQGKADRIRQMQGQTRQEASQRIQGLLDRYCHQACQLLDVKVSVYESLPETEEPGFESRSQWEQSHLEVQSMEVDLQIDSKVLAVDKDRLEALLRNQIKGLSPDISLRWSEVDLPQIGNEAPPASEDLRNQLEQRLKRSVEIVFERYCPEQCLLEKIDIEAKAVKAQELNSYPREQLVLGKKSEGGIAIEAITLAVTMDESLEEEEQKRILRLLKAQTRYISPIDIQASTTAFPLSAQEKKQRQQIESADPYGLEKLRQMLTLFRELAGTKEIIQTSQSDSVKNSEIVSQLEKSEKERIEAEKALETQTTERATSETSSESKRETLSESSRNESKELSSTEKESSRRMDISSEVNQSKAVNSEEFLVYGIIAVLVLTLVAIILLKMSAANRSAKQMMVLAQDKSRMKPKAYSAEESDDEDGGQPSSGRQQGFENRDAPQTNSGFSSHQERAHLSLKLSQLKQDLIQQFIEQPRIAKETFTRLIKDDGVAETAKYVHIFGQLIVFELLNDSSLKRDLYELSEFYHRSQFRFDTATEMQLLERLKTMVTASEIRLLASQSSDRFGFLNRLDAQQLFVLIRDEKTRIQSIVLTQIDRKLRTSLFEMFEGDAKIKLLEELSQAEAIPREFLFNVAQALQKKMQSRSEFDTEQLRSSDILLDLLERSEIRDQKRLMQTLEKNNPETARGLKLKLVTVEMMPYLKDGHLLELILGLDREDLLAFLIGVREDIRDTLLRKAPEELAQSWIEDIRNMSGLSDSAYRQAEVKIKARIRGLAANGAISLLDINEIIFAYKEEEQEEEEQILSKASFAA